MEAVIGESTEMEALSLLIDRLTRAYPELSRQLKRAASYLLDHPADVAMLTMRGLAAEAGVPPSTLPRLAKVLGYATYRELRAVFQAGHRERGPDYRQRAESLRHDGAGSRSGLALIEEVRRRHLANVDKLVRSLAEPWVEPLLDLWLACGKVYVVGMQASAYFTGYAHYIGHMAFPNWVLVPNENGVVADFVTAVGSDDALIGFAFRPCARDTIRVTQFAKRRGAHITAITGSRSSPLASIADAVFVVPTDSPQFFESFAPTVMLVEMLVVMMVARTEHDVGNRIQSLEDARHALGEYWDDWVSGSARD